MRRDHTVGKGIFRLILFSAATLFNAMTPGMSGLTFFFALATLPVAYHLFKTLDARKEDSP